MKYLVKNKKAFTLIEVLLAILVFSIFMAVVLSSFLNFMRSYRQTNEKRKVAIEARQFVDRVTQELRLGSIDYDCYIENIGRCGSDISNISDNGIADSLVIIRKNNLERVFFKKQGKTIQMFKQNREDTLSDWKDTVSEGFTEWQTVLGDQFETERLYFRILPIDNPYLPIYAAQSDYQYQPKVTVFLTLRSKLTTQENDSNLIDIQTTVSSRNYGRENLVTDDLKKMVE
ncbi:hypothetical protein A2229_01725 [Candidatus Peregrinibacteria bacterium RIFOXYA2_FULL_33_7]|nr:MAG: hypothetical protein UR30_C0016G0011 [Candidatus Peregrinibacteria bacterium GW2011_GWC2_33_13]OGJ49300.1 MAG: hypothetical protein A2229_01725 [Candidatus Peregrinibacteria bacterium RIFOXYA2_FULL_33_7]